MSAIQPKPRIVIYGMGQFSHYITRFAINKGWPIVAAFNRAGSKVGQDVGQLTGLGYDIGVVVQDCDTASYDNLDADIAVMLMTDDLHVNFPAYRRLMGAGLNVVCVGGDSYLPSAIDPELAAEIDKLAKANNVTFTGTGIWDMSRIWSGILVAGPCTEINALHLVSITNAENNGLAQMLMCAVGMSTAEFQKKVVQAKRRELGMYKTVPQLVLKGLGYTVTEVIERIEPVFFDQPQFCKLLDRELEAGVCVGTRIVAEIHTREGVTADAHIELRLFKAGETEHMSWAVDGKPVSRIRVEREDATHATPSSIFNRIPDVIAARPGIVDVTELGPIRHSAL